MPGHRQPQSLEALSLKRVCRLLDCTCRRLQVLSQESSAAQVLAYAKQTIRPYYANALTARLRSQVIEETSRMLYGPSSDGSTLISGPAPLYLLALLLGHDIKRLKVNLCCYYGCSHQTSLLKLLATEGVGLEALELARSALLRLDCKLLRSALLSAKNLQRLTLRNIASDAVLQVVGKACPKLCVLDVACSRQVTDAGLKQLLLHVEFRDRLLTSGQNNGNGNGNTNSNNNDNDCKSNKKSTSRQESSATTTTTTRSWSRLKSLLARLRVRGPKSGKRDKHQQVLLEHCESRNALCDNLRVLNVANTGVTSAGVLLALMHAPRLESLAEYSHMGRVCEIMSRGGGGGAPMDFKTPFALKQARSCRTTPARLELLAQACPRLEKLHVSEPHHAPGALGLFASVASLSVHGIPARKEWLEGFYGYLRAHGQRLRELDLRVVAAQNEAPPDVDLREIFAHCPGLRVFTLDGSNVGWSVDGGCGGGGPEQSPPTMRHLRKVQVGRNVSATAIARIVALAPELQALHAHTCYDLTNEQLEKLLSEPAAAARGKSAASASASSYQRSASLRRAALMGATATQQKQQQRNSLVRNLECFYIYEASKVSAATVLGLFKNCGKLRRIGNLANWGLDCEGVRTLRGSLAGANLDVELCAGSHWFWNDCIQ